MLGNNPKPPPKTAQPLIVVPGVYLKLVLPQTTLDRLAAEAAELGQSVEGLMQAKLATPIVPRYRYALDVAQTPSAN